MFRDWTDWAMLALIAFVLYLCYLGRDRIMVRLGLKQALVTTRGRVEADYTADIAEASSLRDFSRILNRMPLSHPQRPALWISFELRAEAEINEALSYEDAITIFNRIPEDDDEGVALANKALERALTLATTTRECLETMRSSLDEPLERVDELAFRRALELAQDWDDCDLAYDEVASGSVYEQDACLRKIELTTDLESIMELVGDYEYDDDVLYRTAILRAGDIIREEEAPQTERSVA